jgi:hypothetical protein
LPSSTILFDGALPKAKQYERAVRNDRYNAQVNGLRANFPSEACPRPTSLGSTSYSFLAPALREALADSEYASLTFTVPGEADDWCAPYANKHPSTVIFSDDTDLLLYEFPRDVRIISFRDSELWPEPKFKGYYPARICQQLGLPSLGVYAYLLTNDPHKAELKLLEEAKCVDTASEAYNDFIKRYTVTSESINTFDIQWADASLQRLDVRVSEVVHQCLNSVPAPVAYLPFLVEDKHRSSAWNVGQDLRAVSYSLIAKDGIKVREHRRKAQRVTKQDVQMYESVELRATLQTYVESIRSWIEWTTERQVPQTLVWPLYAVSMLLPELKTPPFFTQLCRLLSADFDNTWNFIHLTGCLHAGLYSLRMLKQCAAVWLTLNKNDSSHLLLLVTQLQTDLQSLGSIAELFLVPGQARKHLRDHDLVYENLAEIYAAAKVEVPIEQKSAKRGKKQQREAERKERRKQEGGTKTSDNTFDVLSFMNAARKN